jgi:hypothetical protein
MMVSDDGGVDEHPSRREMRSSSRFLLILVSLVFAGCAMATCVTGLVIWNIRSQRAGIERLPMYPDAQNVRRETLKPFLSDATSCTQITRFDTPDVPENVRLFYLHRLLPAGWNDMDSGVNYRYEKPLVGSYHLTVILLPLEPGKTEVTLQLEYRCVSAILNMPNQMMPLAKKPLG